jgi:predicted small secreted protein
MCHHETARIVHIAATYACSPSAKLLTDGNKRQGSPVFTEAQCVPFQPERNRSMPSRFVAITLLLATSLLISACANTVRGVGRDVQSTADAVEDVAQ